jgi:leucyl-tRNA synthetase
MSPPLTAPKYTPATIEPKWQQHWSTQQAFLAEADVETHSAKPKYYVLEMLPYPSGQLHMGHVRNYTLGDVLARFKRAKGFNVMHPMGWDAFGLPAENAAMKRGIHPKTWTLNNIAEMKTIMQAFGWSYDWRKEITSCLPSYYGPQQALFLDMYEKGLVYRGEALVNWDPVDHTVLANEQVVDGKGWRSGAPVERRKMPQWCMAITKYADQLLTDLNQLPGWPQRVKTMQENWLGKSYGVEFSFQLTGPGLPADAKLQVYTTRPDTMMGTSFAVLSPEHAYATLLAESDPQAATFIAEAKQMGTAQEIVDRAEKKGYPTPYKAIHPFTGEKMPVWIGNFVLATYGTGAIKSAPAHDERDFAFAKKYNLPIRPVITGPGMAEGQPYTLKGTLINSGQWDGLTSDEAIQAVIAKMEAMGIGKGKTIWRLRDWGVSRQRYWGCPIPFVHCPTCGVVPVPREQLPVVLPDDVTFSGSGNPLSNHPTWKHTTCPTCSGKAERETDTMDTFMDSSWYFLRYLCPTAKEPLDKAAVAYWMAGGGIDQYIGGIEHAVLHLLYARFFTKALRDCGYPVGDEPFKALLCQGMVIGNSYQKADGTYLYPSQIELKDGKAFEKATGHAVTILPMEKISKSKNNGDSPDELLARYGADTLRLFILFTAPPERDLEWSEAAIEGAWRFLNRMWATTQAVQAGGSDTLAPDAERALLRKLHQTIAKVTHDIEHFQYNTMVAACMELANTLQKAVEQAPAAPAVRTTLAGLVQLLNPAVPHLTEELWQQLGHPTPLTATPWPVADAALAKEDEITLVVQINGKLRAKLTLSADADETTAVAAALAAPEIVEWLQGVPPAKTIYVPGRLVNLVQSA